MQNFSVVSVDMFQTLVNVKTRCFHVWKEILKDNYSGRLAESLWASATELIFKNYDQLFIQRKFLNSRAVIEMSFAQLFPQVGLDFNPGEAAKILAEQHGFSSPYRDTGVFLKAVGKHFPICLVSDTDDDMVSPLLELYEFDRVFTSEQIRSYKNSPGGEIFKAVVNHYGTLPESIIHIGDSIYDVLGAARIGIKTCWLNRNKREWNHEIQPDYTVKTLLEAASILGVDTGAEFGEMSK